MLSDPWLHIQVNNDQSIAATHSDQTQINTEDTLRQKCAVITFIYIYRLLIRAYIHYIPIPFKEHFSITFPYTFGPRVMPFPMSSVVEEIQTDSQHKFPLFTVFICKYRICSALVHFSRFMVSQTRLDLLNIFENQYTYFRFVSFNGN